MIVKCSPALLVAMCAMAQTTTPTVSTLHSFEGAPGDGAGPIAGLVIGGSGVLYGTTSNGGASNQGTVFSLKPPTSTGGSWTETVLHNFSGPDGALPGTTLAIGSGGVLYGTTAEGGSGSCPGGCGTVFSLTPSDGGWTEAMLYNFTGGSDGSNPTGLTIGAGRVLYGTTNNIDSAGVGTVFSLTPPASAGGAWTESVLHTFTGPDGGFPEAGVVQGTGGALYGTTYSGGATDVGVVFRLTPPASPGGTWKETVIHSFTGSDGGFISAGVAIGSGGVLYGTASLVGGSGDGTVYSLAPPLAGSNAWTIDVLCAFSGSNGNSPAAGVTIGEGGVLYGTTTVGGASGNGVVFSLTPPSMAGGSWTEKVLHSFTGSPEGSDPNAVLAIGGNGVLFGTTTGGGTANLGTVFAVF